VRAGNKTSNPLKTTPRILLGGAAATALPTARVEQNAVGAVRRQAATAPGDLMDSAGERVRAAKEASIVAVEESHLAEAVSNKIRSLAQTARAAVSTAIDVGLNPNSGKNAHG
jgi:hypothetical protein